MRKDGIFINVGRGGLCETDDLVKALKNGEIFGAGLDCTDPEPLPKHHPLLHMKNCFVVPHIGSATEECRGDMLAMAISNMKCGLRGMECNNYVV